MNKNRLLFVLLSVALLCVLGLFTYYYLSTPRDSASSDAREVLGGALDQQFISLAGEPVTFTEHEGKIRVVTTWASWNPFSVADLQVVNDVAKEYAERSEPVVFLAINRKEPKEQAERFLASVPQLPYLQFVIDNTDSYYTATGGYAMPETILYSERGTLTAHVRGTVTHDQLRTLIEDAKKVQ
jgi:thiol-disulfide isomerase/thioredoxin